MEQLDYGIMDELEFDLVSKAITKSSQKKEPTKVFFETRKIQSIFYFMELMFL